MTGKDKMILLTDLCARLTYGVILSVGIFDNGDMKYHNKKLDCHSNLLSLIELDGGYYFNGLLCRYSQFTVKPYLRPMSSMTEDEREELEDISHGWFYVNEEGEIFPIGQFSDSCAFEDAILPSFKYLNKNMFDYRGLISRGLALEAPEGMYEMK